MSGEAHADARPARPGRTVPVPVERWGATARRGPGPDEVVTEEPLEIRVDAGRGSVPVAITLRTPGHDFELAAGFALAEGIVRGPEEIRGIRYCAPAGTEQEFNVVTLELAGRPDFDVDRFRRNVFTNSSCGVCGKATLDRLRTEGLRRPGGTLRVAPARLVGLPDALRRAQPLFACTGGSHATGVADAEGRVGLVREDVGRHNAFDKVVGRLALDDGLPASGSIAVVSGRASFELVQKALVAGFPVLAAVGAPSHLAVALAREYGLTLVGFVRPDGLSVYSGAERLVPDGTALEVPMRAGTGVSG